MRRAAFLILVLLVIGCPTLGAKTFDLDSATIADIYAAFEAGTLTAERLVQLCLARIHSYDREGPSLHAVMVLNLKAIETARELDAERKAKGPRSALHGIPVVLKDNYNTADLPTTGGSVLLEGSIPSADAFVVQKLRDAGAIILAKMNMSEFASPPSQSSLGGQSLNPHDLRRTPWRFNPRAIDGERHCGFGADAWAAQQKRDHPACADF
jgi:amidase